MTLHPLNIRCPYCGLIEAAEIPSKKHTLRIMHECKHCYEMYVLKITNILVTSYRLEEHEHYTIKDKPLQELFECETPNCEHNGKEQNSMLMRYDDKERRSASSH